MQFHVGPAQTNTEHRANGEEAGAGAGLVQPEGGAPLRCGARQPARHHAGRPRAVQAGHGLADGRERVAKQKEAGAAFSSLGGRVGVSAKELAPDGQALAAHDEGAELGALRQGASQRRDAALAPVELHAAAQHAGAHHAHQHLGRELARGGGNHILQLGCELLRHEHEGQIRRGLRIRPPESLQRAGQGRAPVFLRLADADRPLHRHAR
mmetsp:Transcript_8275/g.27319  ORF Transcript_8275/g.27319 Transcript_8275/m.27319 type:complete len:210 (-) Transcript_8275:121-750(-)